MSEILEALMMIAFGFAWPTNIMTAWKAKTARGMSPAFFFIVNAGYICGIASKIISGHITYVLAFYILNFTMVSINIGIYFRNRRFDRAGIEK